ncbi:restriction endonuclease subunit S [Aequorivita ciconiae]|nr:restriction endonuclease subunit S [Aequorivita sp. H23M31]
MSWKYVKLGTVCNTGAGGTPLKSKKEYYENGTIPWLRSGEVNNRNIIDSEIKITEKGLNNSSAKLFPTGTVLIAMYGATAGQVGILNFESSTNQAVCGVLPSENFATEFLYYFFLSFKDELISQAVGNAQPNISQAKIRNTLIPLIPLQEQQQIVAILDEAFEAIDQAIANIEKNIANAQELFQSKLNEIFSQRGEGWEICLLNEICEVKDGTHDSPKYVSEDNGIPFVTQKNILEDGLSFVDNKFISLDDHENFYRRSNVTENDLLFSMIGANRGMVCIVDDGRTFSIKNVGLIKSSENYRSKYLLYFLKSPIARNYVSDNSSGSAQGFIGLGKLRAFPIPMTTLDRQKSIEIIIDSLNDNVTQIIYAYQMKINSLEELKKSILQKAFAGKLTNKMVESLQLAAEPEERY